MARFVPDLIDPSNHESVAAWAADVADVVNGQISIGEPISHDAVMHPNGVKGHLLGSFVTIPVDDLKYPLDTACLCHHNLNVPNKAAGGLNVGWVIVRIEHDGTGVGVTSTVSCNYDTRDSAGITENAIPLRFYAVARTVTVAHPMNVTLWFFPTTR